MPSSAYVIAKGIDYTYRFAGVTSIEHTLSLNLDADTSAGGDIIHGARRKPNQVKLSVVESDSATQPGWSAAMLAALDSIRRNRILCRVVTSMGAYSKMLLSEITATQDEENPCGWSGELTFVEYTEKARVVTGEAGEIIGTGKRENNSSTRMNTGSMAPAQTVSGNELEQLLQRAGIS